jgi:hypothetical protein
MSVKSFKFVSPGVFINEIDNSFIPKSADAIGPVVIGRAQRGLAMQPIKVQSYSEFVELFGDTVAGNGGGDVYRGTNMQSPMYGTYAAKAFLRSNVAPLTYIRLLGQQHTDATAAGYAGWKTTAAPQADHSKNGGAYGMFVIPSGTAASMDAGALAAVFYVDSGSAVLLSGSYRGGFVSASCQSGTFDILENEHRALGVGVVIGSDSNGLYTVVVSGSDGNQEKITFNFNDESEFYIRKRFNTNPHLGNLNASTFYPAAAEKRYFLGETFEQMLRDGVDGSLTGGGTDLTSAEAQAVILPIASGSGPTGPHGMSGISSNEATSGWFIGQDLGSAASYAPENAIKLFRLIGRGHGEWLSKNAKVSIENIRISTSNSTDYGTFSVVIRMLNDTDNNVQVMERFDNLTLDPSSPNFIARVIGDVYYEWSDSDRQLKKYGEYDNQSKYVRVAMNEDVESGQSPASLLPFGYYGPPKFKNLVSWDGFLSGNIDVNSVTYVYRNATVFGSASSPVSPDLGMLTAGGRSFTGSLNFPFVRLRLSSSDGGLPDQTNAYFGMRNTRTQTSTRADPGIKDAHRLWLTSLNSDPIGSSIAGVNSFAYIFSLDDIVKSDSVNAYFYVSGARAGERAYGASGGRSFKDLLDADINRFTAPFWGGYDAVDIYKPDPFYNAGIGTGETTSYTYNTIKRAVDTVADGEYINMNMLTMPGLTKDALTEHMITVCEARGDALAMIDLASVYIPGHEQKLSKSARIGTTPTAAATALRNRRLDSSYGCTFYPWVQTRDAGTGQLLWVPPTVAMLGVFGSSQAKSDVWFAPAGFNRGGLSDGAAGIPITNVTERLTSKDRDVLYENRINPIASFPSSGIVVFGQKTLQERQSALDRINVRRLVIYLKKQISVLSTQVLFEQNVQATWDRFKGLIEPFLANVKVQFGITDYRLILDDTTTTPDLIDQNIMYAKIMVKPARAIEFIAIDFVIASTGASFDD